MNIPHVASLKVKSGRKPNGAQFSAGRKDKLFRYIVIGSLFTLLVGYLGGTVYQKLCHSNFFQITTMKIEGNRMVTKKQISRLSKVDIHSNLLAINLSQVKSLLESHPWIYGVKITRDWPNRLVIAVREKEPFALLNRETGLFYLDKKGHIIAAADQYQDLDFPVITGLERYPFDPAASDRPPEILLDAMKLLTLASRNNSILPEQNISEIHITEKGALLLHLLDKPFPIYMGSDGDISSRYYRLVKVLRDLYRNKEFSGVSYIRLDYQKDTILVGKEKSASGQHG